MATSPAETKRALSQAIALLARGAAQAWHGFARFAGRKPTTTRMRHQTLMLLRWLAIVGQALAIIFVHVVLGHPVPVFWCAIPIAASIWLNLVLAFRYPPSKRLSDREAAGYMAFDIVQLASLLYLTGGLLNPFAILFLAPTTIAASTLSRGATIVIGLLSVALVSVLAAGLHWPLPWPDEEGFMLPRRYEFGIWVALVIGLLFSAIFAWRVAAEANRMSNALAATELVLAREQRLSAVGALAAAAAHELGTPLATIAVVTRELERELSAGPLSEDVALLRTQAERCREILNRLTREAQEGASHQAMTTLSSLLEEVIAPHRDLGIEIDVRLSDERRGGEGAPARDPEVLRRPEIVHGLGNILENAVDFAESRVIVEIVLTPAQVRVRISDDGPGFPKDVLDHLGEPFMTTRSRLEVDAQSNASEDGSHHGMGLGFFIAKTLLERTGGQVAAGNTHEPGDLHSEHPKPRGAVVSITWLAGQILAPVRRAGAAAH